MAGTEVVEEETATTTLETVTATRDKEVLHPILGGDGTAWRTTAASTEAEINRTGTLAPTTGGTTAQTTTPAASTPRRPPRRTGPSPCLLIPGLKSKAPPPCTLYSVTSSVGDF